MKIWQQKNQGVLLYRMFGENEYAYACFVLKNMGGVWEQSWNYNKDNSNTADSEKRMFNKNKNKSHEETEADGKFRNGMDTRQRRVCSHQRSQGRGTWRAYQGRAMHITTGCKLCSRRF